MRTRTFRAAVVAGIATGGVTLGHLLGYRITVPQSAARHDLLAETGHAYGQAAGTLAGAIALLACAAALGFGLARGLGFARHRMALRWAVTRTAMLQACAFVLLESAERILSGSPLAALIGKHLIVGLAIQIVVGAIAGLALVLLDRAGEWVGASVVRTRRPARTFVFIAPPLDDVVPALWFGAGRSIRGPPALPRV